VSQVSRVLYPAHPVDMFVRLSDAQYAAVARDGLSVTATDPVRGGAKVWSIAVAACVAVGDLLEKLYANHVINELSKKIDANEGNRAEALSVIVKLSAAHGIMNKHTSFLVISDEQIAADTLSSVQEVAVPHFADDAADGIALGNNFPTASHSALFMQMTDRGTSQPPGMIMLSTGAANSGNSGAIYIGTGVGTKGRKGHVYVTIGGTGGAAEASSGASGGSMTPDSAEDSSVSTGTIASGHSSDLTGSYNLLAVDSAATDSVHTGRVGLITGSTRASRGGSVYVSIGGGYTNVRGAEQNTRIATCGASAAQDSGGDVSLSAGTAHDEVNGHLSFGSVTVLGGAAVQHGADVNPMYGSITVLGGASVQQDADGNPMYGSITFRGGSSAPSGSAGDIPVHVGASLPGHAPADLPVGVILTTTSASAHGSGGDISFGTSSGAGDISATVGASLPGHEPDPPVGLIVTTTTSSAQESGGSMRIWTVNERGWSARTSSSSTGFIGTVFGIDSELHVSTGTSKHADGVPDEQVGAVDIRSAAAQPISSTEERIVEIVKHSPGALIFHRQSYLLLQYASETELWDDAVRAHLNPVLFFNVVCLLRARKVAAPDVLQGLESYVRSVVTELKIAEVAVMLNLM
jgi:hypothetical protein